MTDRIHIRVTMLPDGKTPHSELIVDGEKVTDISFFETIRLLENGASTLKWYGTTTRMARAFD